MWSHKECLDCQWCCRHTNLPLPWGIQHAYLEYIKGTGEVYWEPNDKRWYVLTSTCCQHIKANGCSIYVKRPLICKKFYCPFGPEWIERRYKILIKAGKQILKTKIEAGYFNSWNDWNWGEDDRL